MGTAHLVSVDSGAFSLVCTSHDGFAAPASSTVGRLGRQLDVVGCERCLLCKFFYRYHDYPSPWWEVTRGIEHGVLWIFLATFLVYELVFRNRHAPLPIEGGGLSSPGTDYV